MHLWVRCGMARVHAVSVVELTGALWALVWGCGFVRGRSCCELPGITMAHDGREHWVSR